MTVTVGYLIRELGAIVHQYVGADLSDFVLVYDAFTRDPKRFRWRSRTPEQWQKIANNCAAFYPEGCEWLLSVRRSRFTPVISWTLVFYHAIRHGNIKLATVERLLDHPRYLPANIILNRDEYNLPEKKSLCAHDVYAIAAIDSGEQEVLAEIMRHGMLHETVPSRISMIHLYGRNMLCISPQKLFPFATHAQRIKWFSDSAMNAYRYGNSEALEVLLQLVPQARIMGMPLWCSTIRRFSRKTADVLYKWMQSNNMTFITALGQYLAHPMMLRIGQLPLDYPEFVMFAIRKEGRAFAVTAGDQTELHEDVLLWLGNVIENDDMFWTELGL